MNRRCLAIIYSLAVALFSLAGSAHAETACYESSEPFRIKGEEIAAFFARTDAKPCFSPELEELAITIVGPLNGEIEEISRMPPPESPYPSIVQSLETPAAEIFEPQAESTASAEQTEIQEVDETTESFDDGAPTPAASPQQNPSPTATPSPTNTPTCTACIAYEYQDDWNCQMADNKGEKACFDIGKYTQADGNVSNCKYDEKTGSCSSLWKTVSQGQYDRCMTYTKNLPAPNPYGNCINGEKGCPVDCILFKRGEPLGPLTKEKGCTCTAILSCGHGRPGNELITVYQLYIEGGATNIFDTGCNSFSNFDAMMQAMLQIKANLPEGKCVKISANQVTSAACATSSYSSAIQFKLCGGKDWSAEYGPCKGNGVCYPDVNGNPEAAGCCVGEEIKCALCEGQGQGDSKKYTWQIYPWGGPPDACKKSRYTQISCPPPTPTPTATPAR